MKYLASALIVAGITFGCLYAIENRSHLFGGNGGLTSSSCTASSTTMTIGNQMAKTILQARSNRAYASIEQPANATNTVSTSMGGTAVAGQGPQLTPATSTSPRPILKLGRATDFPYVGAVSAITNSGSTTVSVNECLY